MVVAAPGVGKSAWATIYASKAHVGTLYFSADTDPHTMTCRLAAALTGTDQETIDAAIREGRGAPYLDAVDSLERFQLSFDSSPSMDDIYSEVDAYAMVFGAYPELIVVDNLMDVYSDGDNEFSAQRAILDELHQLARATSAHVMVLHHAIGEFENGNEPIPLRGVQNKLSKKPEMVLTLYRIHDQWTDSLGVCVVKHRNGRADASAKTTIWLKINLSTMEIKAPEIIVPTYVNTWGQ